MELVFGLHCDGAVYPDFPGSGAGAICADVVGPSGLLATLELELGLTAPAAAVAVRIAEYATKLRAALSVKPNCFFAASFSRDPFATAKSLLNYRDQLVTGGWRPISTGLKRLDEIALVERSGEAVAKGSGDRLFDALEALKGKPQLSITSITTVEERQSLPPVWGRLLDALEACGTKIEGRKLPSSDHHGTDLDRVQHFLEGGCADVLVGDGTAILIEADTSLMAAEALADWLAAGPEEELSGTVVIDTSGDTALLDEALAARGLPKLGHSLSSPYRGALQILPLAFAAVWRPFNPKPLLDLLLLPRPPIGRSAARRLARALIQEPGAGGPVWNAAWEKIRADLLDRFSEKAAPEAEVEKRVSRWRDWTQGGLYDRQEGIPVEAARSIAARVAQWAAETDASEGDPILRAAMGTASTFIEAVDALAEDFLPALLIERILEQVMANGAANPEQFATAGGLRAVTSPAAVWDRAERIVWWDFKGPGDGVPMHPWTRSETEALQAAGCELEPASQAANRISSSYANAVQMAGRQLMFVRSTLSAGQETTSHPLAHQLQPLLGAAGRLVTWNAEELLRGPSHAVGRRTLSRAEISILPIPQARAKWELPPTILSKLQGRVESATTLERLVDCQLRWLLSDVLRLSGGRFAELPGPDQLIGNLAHEVARRVFQPGPIVVSSALEAEISWHFDDLLSVVAAPLQQPELAAELVAARARVPEAILHLARWLADKNFEVVGTEIDCAKSLSAELAIRGRIDLLVRHHTRGLGVIDLKWSKSARRRRTELSEGRALQLAAYGVMADAEGGRAAGAYYLLNQRRLIGLEGALVADEEVTGRRTLEETWDDLLSTWQTWLSFAGNGIALTAGAADAAEHLPPNLAVVPTDEPCRYCELTRLCRIGVEEA
ncbi:PD-(D/E)XK nuclease family protein [Devosia sp. RR2S18]|uniref:PD-(D/E)XK nuclease family protein n=1 Tax=Devosia rhizosphaerae TaxID=3049774 RepID=UPI002540FB90|nr:PD-(D/E)XK nuclease family protein [Devosia sp. RR2S18]WIJ25786.1 PD-(D/E)XK nuclease family protein [Devosia sp. RR2S18]